MLIRDYLKEHHVTLRKRPKGKKVQVFTEEERAKAKAALKEYSRRFWRTWS